MTTAGAVASLPMYARAETRAALAQFWNLIREELRLLWKDDPRRSFDLPISLSLPDDLMAHWRDPGLALSQTCGLPYRTELWPDVTLVGTPDYRLPGCAPGYYNSVFVMRADDPRRDPTDWPGLRFACNDPRSQSGWAAAQSFMTSQGLSLDRIILTGSHQASAIALATGRADLASIDAQSWRMLCRWEDVSMLTEVMCTDPTPGLPLITAGGHDADDLHYAVSASIDALDAEARSALDLHSLVGISRAQYQAVPTPPFPWAIAEKLARS